MTPEELVDKTHNFEDGTSITVIQIKQKDVGGEVVPFVTYHITQYGSLPRKLVMPFKEFNENFGHLFQT